MTIGGACGGFLMKIGRRNAQFVNILIGLAGIGICYPLHPIAWILSGRFLGGLSTGLFSSTIPRYYEETIPSHLYDRLAPIVFTFS